MQANTAGYIEGAALELGLDCEFIEGYDGQGLYPRPTAGVKMCDGQGIFQAIALAAARIAEGSPYCNSLEDMTVDEFVYCVGEIETDKAGSEDVIYY